MKKRNGFVMAASAHLILWGVLLAVSVIHLLAVLCFPLNTDILLGYVLEKVIAALMVGTAAVGALDGALLLFSVRGTANRTSGANRKRSVAALGLSAAATAAHYALFILLFAVNRDWIRPYLLLLALTWLGCAVGSGVLLCQRREKDE